MMAGRQSIYRRSREPGTNRERKAKLAEMSGGRLKPGLPLLYNFPE
jgi:hypothetical protein